MRGLYYLNLLALLLLSCTTMDNSYGDKAYWSAEMHFKFAQDATNRKAYKQALKEYDEILIKFSHQVDKVLMAQYERAIIFLRLKRYAESHAILEQLNEDLVDPYKTASVPGWLRVMVPIIYEHVETKMTYLNSKKIKEAEL